MIYTHSYGEIIQPLNVRRNEWEEERERERGRERETGREKYEKDGKYNTLNCGLKCRSH